SPGVHGRPRAPPARRTCAGGGGRGRRRGVSAARAAPATLTRGGARARRYGLSAFCHEVAGAEAVKAVTGPKFPYCLAWTGAPDARAALEALKPALAGAIEVDGRPIVLAGADIHPAASRQAARQGGPLPIPP